MIAFFVVLLSMVLGAHVYLGVRMIRGAQLPRWQRLSVMAGLGLSFCLGMITMPLRDTAWAQPFLVLGYLAIGIFGAFFFMFLFKDILWGLGTLLDKAVPVMPQDPDRRRLLQNALNLGVIGSAAGVGLVGFAKAQSAAKVEEVTVPIEGLPPELEGFSIVQISDVHVGPTVRRARIEEIVGTINGLDADLVAVTGDLVDGSVEGLKEHVAPLEGIKSRHGVFFTTGNHEYYSGAEAWCEHVSSALGMTVLVDEHVTITHQGHTLVVGGVADLKAAEHVASHRSDPFAAIEGAPENAALRLLLAHQPPSIYDAALAGWDLVLSGHTHAGQFFPFTLLIHLAQPFVAGLHKVEKAWLYVNRGTTYWGPPIRLGAAQEITRLVLMRA